MNTLTASFPQKRAKGKFRVSDMGQCRYRQHFATEQAALQKDSVVSWDSYASTMSQKNFVRTSAFDLII